MRVPMIRRPPLRYPARALLRGGNPSLWDKPLPLLWSGVRAADTSPSPQRPNQMDAPTNSLFSVSIRQLAA